MVASGDLHLPISFTAQRAVPGVKNAVHTPEAAAVIAPSVSSLESIVNTPIIIQKQESMLVPPETNTSTEKEDTTNTKAQEDQPLHSETKLDSSPLPAKQTEVASSPSQSSTKSKQVEKCVSLCVLTSLCLLDHFHQVQVLDA